MARLALLVAALALVIGALAGPVPLKARESVYAYQVSVGRERDCGALDAGLTISARVIVRQRTDGPYHIQLQNVAIKDAKGADVGADKYEKLQERLDVPFEYDQTANTIKVFAPETIRCESVNLKRGLVNLLEVFDESTGAWTKLSPGGSSGQCPEVVTTDTEDNKLITNRFTSSNNCTATISHQVVKTRSVSLRGTMCGANPEVRRNLNVRSEKNKPGQAPSLVVRSKEHIELHSSIPHGLFDDVLSQSELTLEEVRDVTDLGWTPTDSAVTTPEVDVTGHWQQTQEEGVKRAGELFKKLQQCLTKLDQKDHLEEQHIPDLVVGLVHALKGLNKESLQQIYQGIDASPDKDPTFFQILGLVGTPATFEVVRDIYVGTDLAYAYRIGEALADYFERIDFKTRSLDAQWAKPIVELYKKITAQGERANQRARNGAILAASAVVFENCVKRGPLDTNCPAATRIIDAIKAAPDTDEVTLLKIKVLGNMQLREGISFLESIINDKSRSIQQRVSATWAFVRMSPRYPTDILPIAEKLFYNHDEDHEIRIAAWFSISWAGTLNQVSAAATHVVDNHEHEDRQVITAVLSSVKAAKCMMKPQGSKCPDFNTKAKHVWETIVKPVYNRLGPKDIFDSATYNIQSSEFVDGLSISIVASKEDVLPRSIYIWARDQLQSRSVYIQTFSDGGLYDGMANLKKLMDAKSGKTKTENPDVKAQLAAVLSSVQSRPLDPNMALMFTRRIDEVDLHYERFTSPQQILQRVMSKSLATGSHLRNIRSVSNVYVKTHTESGLRVAFMMAQGSITSLAVPKLKLSQQVLPVNLRYNYRLLSRQMFSAVVGLPSSKYRYITGKISDKHGAIYRNVTLSGGKKEQGTLKHILIDIKSQPLESSNEKDVFIRQMRKFSGNVLDVRDYRSLIQEERAPQHYHEFLKKYLGFGFKVQHTLGYMRPLPWKGTIARWHPGYQELETETKPYTFKVSYIKDEDKAGIAHAQINIVKGVKDRKYIGFGLLTLDDPSDDTKKSLRAGGGMFVDVDEPTKKASYFIYENRIKNLYMRSRGLMQFDKNTPAIPKLLRGSDWADVYANEKLVVTNTAAYTPTGRSDFDANADLNELINGISDPLATGTSTFYRTPEQAELFGQRENQVEGDANQVAGDDIYSKLVSKSYSHAKVNLKAWDTILKFHGVNIDVKLKAMPPTEFQLLWKKIQYFVVKRHFLHLSFDGQTKAEPLTMKYSSNSTVDNSASDLVFTDPIGTQKLTAITSKILPLIRPSSSPLKIFQCNTFNKPVCTLSAQAEKTEIESFDGHDISADELKANCDYLLAGNCRGKRTFAITYNRASNAYTILYNDEVKVVVKPDGFEVNGQALPDKEGLVGKQSDVVLLQYKGLYQVILPNKVELIREKNSPIGYIRASRLHRGRLCGLCGDHDGNCGNDHVTPEDYGTCAAR